MEIIDGDLSLGRFCGENPALVPILSSSNRLVFKFVSDEKNEARGFALTYKFLWGVPNVIKCAFEGLDLCRGWIQDHFDELDWQIRSGRHLRIRDLNKASIILAMLIWRLHLLQHMATQRN